MHDADVASVFDPSVLAESGVTGHVQELAAVIGEHVSRLNDAYSAIHGEDLFKATNKTTKALLKIGQPVRDMEGYKALIDNLYFLFKEGPGQRLEPNVPQSFKDVNLLRTDLQHDVDHGEKKKVVAKKKKIGETFKRYSGQSSPVAFDPTGFVLVQANLLSAIEPDLRNLAIPK